MIFVTVGTDLPFDRLVRVVDAWAHENERTGVFAQIGRTAWRPSHIQYAPFLEPKEFEQRFSEASLIIGHAGMGTILSALRFEKPVLVMPRRADLGEQRNDHQFATARHLLEMEKINVAFDEHELREQLGRIDELKARGCTGRYATPGLIKAIESFIHRGQLEPEREERRPLGAGHPAPVSNRAL